MTTSPRIPADASIFPGRNKPPKLVWWLTYIISMHNATFVDLLLKRSVQWRKWCVWKRVDTLAGVYPASLLTSSPASCWQNSSPAAFCGQTTSAPVSPLLSPPAQRIPPSIPAVSNDRRPPGPLRDAGPSGPLRVPPAPLFSPLQSPSIVSNPRSV